MWLEVFWCWHVAESGEGGYDAEAGSGSRTFCRSFFSVYLIEPCASGEGILISLFTTLQSLVSLAVK